MLFFPKEYRDPSALRQTVAQFEKSVDDADKTTDPADKLVAALDARRSLHGERGSVISKLAAKARSIDDTVGFIALLGGIGAGLAIVAALSNPVGFALLFGVPALVLTDAGTNFLEGRLKRSFFKTMDGHLDSLRTLEAKAGQVAELTLTENKTEIAASNKFNDIFDSYPEVRNFFTKAFNQSVARAELSVRAQGAPAPQPPSPQP
jgi:hypothetical protein